MQFEVVLQYHLALERFRAFRALERSFVAVRSDVRLEHRVGAHFVGAAVERFGSMGFFDI